MLHTTPVHLAARELRLHYYQMYNHINSGLFLSTTDSKGHVFVDLEECRWSLYWFDRFYRDTDASLPVHPRKVLARRAVIDLRNTLLATDGKFAHNFKGVNRAHLYIKSALGGLLLGILVGLLFVFILRAIWS